MSAVTMQLFFSLLALVALGGAVLCAAARLANGRVGPLALFEDTVRPAATWLAWLVAAVAMSGSLYFSEVVHLKPCRLCWYQRFAMYPLVLVLAVAALTRSRWARRYGLLAAGIGACISAWHYLVEWYPSLEPTNVCSLSNPCTTVWFRRMGFVSIPFMALCGFLAILGLLTVHPGAGDLEAQADQAELDALEGLDAEGSPR